MIRTVFVLIALLALLPAHAAKAAGFSAMVSPPRFEDSAKAGTTYRNVVEITNVAAQSAHFAIATADWEFDAQDTAIFPDALSPDSCRPWVGIEAADITIAANARRRYRFEVAVPPGTADRECRFALMVNGDPENVPGKTALPVAGRIGIIVYLAIGGAAPQLSVSGSQARDVQGRIVPVLRIHNSGNAHGRLDGFIGGRDASGRKFALAPSNLPILPGETRDIPLSPEGDNDAMPAPAIVWPLALKGHLDWSGHRLDIDTSISR